MANHVWKKTVQVLVLAVSGIQMLLNRRGEKIGRGPWKIVPILNCRPETFKNSKYKIKWGYNISGVFLMIWIAVTSNKSRILNESPKNSLQKNWPCYIIKAKVKDVVFHHMHQDIFFRCVVGKNENCRIRRLNTSWMMAWSSVIAVLKFQHWEGRRVKNFFLPFFFTGPLEAVSFFSLDVLYFMHILMYVK